MLVALYYVAIAYERLSGLDEAFLAFETPSAYMHVAVTAIFATGPLSGASGGVDLQRVRRHVESRLDRLPRFRQRLAFVPLVRRACWVDDTRFDLAYHVRHVSLPRPGTDEQLRQRCAEILERQLSRDRPLWEIWIVEGLAGDRFALVVKVHHCIVDGVGGVGVLANLLSFESVEPDAPIRPWSPRPTPTTVQLGRAEWRRRVEGAAAAGRALVRGLTRPLDSLGELAGTAGELWQLARRGFSAASPTCFNRPIGPHRHVQWVALDLESLRKIRRRLGGTLNDVVLAALGGAFEHVLATHGGLPHGGVVHAAIPVNMRAADEMDAAGNRVSIWIVPLPVRHGDPPALRLTMVRRTTAGLKASNAAAGASVLTRAADWTDGPVLDVIARLLDAARIYHVIVTNVPGPPVPLYLAGSMLEAVYPHLPLFENHGLGVALMSYRHQLFVGLVSDWDLSAPCDELAARLPVAVAELAAAAAASVEGASGSHRAA